MLEKSIKTRNNMNLFNQILYTQHYLSENTCQELIKYYNSKKEYRLGVFDPKKTNLNKDKKSEWHDDLQVRDTLSISTDQDFQNKFNQQIIKPYFSQYLMPYYNTKIYGIEPLQFLKYEKDGHYSPHIDGESVFLIDNFQLPVWRRNTKRDYSTLIYLNEDFEGGEFEFTNLKVKIKPTTGTVITFPSDHRFLHAALPVTSGIRYCIVIWSLTESSFKLFETTEKNNDFLCSYY